MIQVGIGQHRVLTHDGHAFNDSIMRCLHDLNGGQPDFPGKRFRGTIPYLGQFLSLGIVGNRDVSRKGHGHAAYVGCTLDIVLPAWRVQSCTDFSDLPADQA